MEAVSFAVRDVKLLTFNHREYTIYGSINSMECVPI